MVVTTKPPVLTERENKAPGQDRRRTEAKLPHRHASPNPSIPLFAAD
jgi:hypothetical protein